MSRPKYKRGLPEPPVRATCIRGQRPCPFFRCRHHVTPVGDGNWAIRRPSCSLDVADLVDAGTPPPSTEQIGKWLGLTRERVRQVEHEAVRVVTGAVIGTPVRGPREGGIRGQTETVEWLRIELQMADGWVSNDTLANSVGVVPSTVGRIVNRLRQRGDPIESDLDKGHRWVK